ncbi:MAG: HlyD family secretion protein [Acetobacteraceae bacterium]|nr:HlyD family secretion protein [Acetobacteraceae bacterium]
MSEQIAQPFVVDGIRTRPKSARVQRLIGLAALLVVLLAGLVAGGFWLRQRLAHVGENDAQVQGEVTTIASRVDGWLMTRPVMEGDHIAKGQVLGELDTRDAKLRLAALVGNVAAHDAQIRQTTVQRDTTQETSDATIADAHAQVAAAAAAVAVASHQADLARSDFARADPLVGRGDISRQNWEHARSTQLQNEATLRQVMAQYTSRQAALAQATAQLGQVRILTAQIEVLRAERDALAAQADQVRQEIADRTLRAPFDGIVDQTFIHPGEYVQAGQWLMMLHDPTNVWVKANIRETEVGRVHVGQKVAVRVDAYPNLALQGHVMRVGNAATNQFALLPSPNPSGNFTKITQRVPVRIALDAPPQPLQPGLMAEVSIDVAP